MGTTAATLHIARPGLAHENLADLSRAIYNAYTKLGWAPPRRNEAADREAILTQNGPYITLNDTACDGLDDGTLQNLAALLSKSLKTIAIVTTVYDSDHFDFLLFHAGKQIDCITDAPGGPDAALKALSGKRQATAWLGASHFGLFQNALPAAGPRMAAQVDLFVSRAKAARALETPFSENRLAAWCDLACLPIKAACGSVEQARPHALAALKLVPRALAAKPEAPTVREFTFTPSDEEDCSYHGYFPAPFPCIPLVSQEFMWGIICRNGGVTSCSVRLTLHRTGPFVVRRIEMQGWSFYNGQIVSEKPLATATLDVPESLARTAHELVLHAPDFGLRGPAPGSKAQAILLLRITVAPPAHGQLRVEPSFEPDGGQAGPVLPPLLIDARAPAWVPVAAADTMPRATEMHALMRLNLPAIHHAVAIVADTGPSLRESVCAILERFLLQCTAPDLTAEVNTHKQLGPSGNLRKNKLFSLARELVTSRAWAKYFDPAQEYQTLRIGITAPGAPWPYAGLLMQTDLQWRHHRLDIKSQPAATAEQHLNVAIWANATRHAQAALGLDWQAACDDFLAWMRAVNPLQGWVTDAAWIPIFDTPEDYAATPYEIVTGSARRGGAAPTNLLKFMAPTVFLGDALAAQQNLSTLSHIADVTPAGTSIEIKLKRGSTIEVLETALHRALIGQQI